MRLMLMMRILGLVPPVCTIENWAERMTSESLGHGMLLMMRLL